MAKRFPNINFPETQDLRKDIGQYKVELERTLRHYLAHIDTNALILGLASNRLVKTDPSGNLDTESFLTNWIDGTLKQITVSDDGDGTVTLSLPQDIDKNADIEFDSLKLNDLTSTRLASTDSNKKIVSIANLADWIAGTLNQVTVTNDGDGTITLSLPQDININADVEFDSLKLNDLTTTRLVSTDSNKKIVSISDLTNWIAGTTNQITVTNDGDGSITLSLPQNINTTSTPQFAEVNITGDNICINATKTPSTATDTGIKGTICWDSTYLYVCTNTDTWVRTLLETW